MKKFFSLLLALTFSFVLFLTSQAPANAQTCGGSVTCCNGVDIVSGPPGCQQNCGSPPLPGCVVCQQTQTCNSTSFEGCSFPPGGGVCGHNACLYYVQSGSCTYTPAPPSCGAGYQQCNTGCLQGVCRPTTKSCAQWAAEQCSSGGGGGGSCGSCSDYCAGADQCFSQGGQQVGSTCSGWSCSPGTGPCLICSGGGGSPGDPPPPTCTAGIGGYDGPPPAAWWLDIPQTQPETIPAVVNQGASGGLLGPFSSSEGWYHIDNAMDTTVPAERNGFYRLEMYSSNPGVISVSQNYYEWNAYGPTFSWSANGPGTAQISYYVYGKPCPACSFTLSCQASKLITVPAPCTPLCTTQCGQSDGCGGTCPATDSGVPTAPNNLSPANGTNVTDTDNNQVISWANTSGFTDSYYLEIYPAGTSCSHAKAYCGVVNGTTYNYSLLNLPGTQVQWRVQANNYSCGIQAGTFTPWQTFGVFGTISGTINADPSASATFSGGNCSGGGGATSPGAGASISAVGKLGQNFTGNITGSTFSVSPWYWNPSGNNTVTLNPGTAPNGFPYTCTCPTGCVFSGINSPTANLRFYLQQNDLVNGGWWQVRGGNTYAAQTSGVATRSYVPTFYCTLPTCIPYILGQDLATGADTAGVAVTGGGAVDSTSDAGNATSNVTQRSSQTVATGQVVTRIRENYDYFLREFSLGLSPSEDFGASANDAQKPTSAPLNGKPAYYRGGDMTIQSPWQVTAGESITVFVDGNLTITDPSSAGQLITVEPGGFLAFIVSGNITVDPSVGNSTLSSLNTNIEGVFISDGTITFQGAGAAAGGDKRLVAAGTYVGWTNIVIQRDFDDGGARKAQNNTIPASTFIFRPDFVDNVPEAMTRSSYIWQETN